MRCQPLELPTPSNPYKGMRMKHLTTGISSSTLYYPRHMYQNIKVVNYFIRGEIRASWPLLTFIHKQKNY